MGDGLESTINGLFLSSPYPGDLKFQGQPTGLLYALSALAHRKEQELGSKEVVSRELPVWCPDGISTLNGSDLETELRDYVSSQKPKVVGISTFSVSYQNAVAIKDLVREINPETVVVFGGAHEDNFVKHYKEKGSIDADFVIAGDGAHLLDSLYALCEKHPTATVQEIKQLAYNQADQFGNLPGAGTMLFSLEDSLQEVQTQEKVEPSQRIPIKLDELPLMPRYLLREEKNLAHGFDMFEGMTAQVMVGQGCPYSCSFCSEGIGTVWYDENAPKSRTPARRLEHLESELQELKAAGYSSIFFDDSTFFAKKKEYMKDVLDLLSKYEFEWGCQTTQSTIHHMKELLPKMVESGMQYVYMGIEHYDGSMIDSFGKSIGGGVKRRGSVESTLEILSDYDIQVGLSLTFGHPDLNDLFERTRETKNSVRYAIDKTQELTDTFETVLGVSLNLITYHPGTPNSERFQEKVGPIDFIGHPNSHGSFLEYEEGIGPHAEGMTEELASFAMKYAQEKLRDKLFADKKETTDPRDFDSDCYIQNASLFERYINHQTAVGEVIDLNHASIARPSSLVHEAVTVGNKRYSALDARIAAANIVGLKDRSQVVIARNTTEALSFTYWLSGLGNEGNVVVSDVENESVARIFREHRDHGNTSGKDGWSTFPSMQVAEDFAGIDEIIKTGTEVRNSDFFKSYDPNTIVNQVDDDTKLVVVSYVSRLDGRVVDVANIARAVKNKNPNCFVAIDAAQALGNIEAIDFETLEKAGVDYMAATPHKTLGSFPLGLLYMSSRAAANVSKLSELDTPRQIIMQGMFDESLDVTPTVNSILNENRYTSLCVAVESLSSNGNLVGNDFSSKVQQQQKLKNIFQNRLSEYDAVVLEEEGASYSSGILAFRLQGQDNAEITQKLQERGIFSSYISQSDSIRVSFGLENTTADIGEYFTALDEITKTEIVGQTEDQHNVLSLADYLPSKRLVRQVGTGFAVAAAALFAVFTGNQMDVAKDNTCFESASAYQTHLQDEGVYADRAMRMYRPCENKLTLN